MSEDLITGGSVSNHILQTFVASPRSRENPKNPRIISGLNTAEEGKDGRYYKLLDEKDQHAFKILSDDEVQKELENSRKLFSSTLTGSPTSFSASFNVSSSPSRQRKSPTKAAGSAGIGTVSDSRRLATKNWLHEVELSASATVSTTENGNSSVDVVDPIIKSLIDNGNIHDKQILSNRFRDGLLTSKDDSGLNMTTNNNSLDSNKDINNENYNDNDNENENESPNSPKRRPQSASGSPPRFKISNNLQSDIDNFVSRRKIQLQLEKQMQYEQEAYLLSLKEKTIRASLDSGAGISSMLARQSDYISKAEAKAAKKREEEEVLKKQEREKYESKKKHHLNKPIIKHDKTLQELQEEEEVKRKERVRKRQLELKIESAAPVFSSVNRSSTKKYPEPYKPFKAEDPEKVRKNLEHQSQIWKNKMKKISDKLTMEAEERERNASRSQSGAIYESMKARNDFYEEKRRINCELKLEKERLEREVEIAKEKAKKQKLLNMKVPESSRRLTKKVELQAKIVRDRLAASKKLKEQDFTFTSFKAKDPEEVISDLLEQQKEWENIKEERKAKYFAACKSDEENQSSRQATLLNEQLLSRQDIYRNKAATGAKKCISCIARMNDPNRFKKTNEITRSQIDTGRSY